MIVRPHICLRCQLRFTKRSLSTGSRSTYRQSPALGEEEFKQVAANPPNSQPLDESEARATNKRRYKGNERGTRLQKLFSEGHRGVLRHRNREVLKDLDALGEPSEVLVLKESKFRLYNHSIPSIDEKKAEEIDILATLDSERGLVRQSEVDENINGLRPDFGDEPQDWDEFNNLVQSIEAGFTSSQLTHYIKAYGTGRQEPHRLSHDPKLVPNVSPWTPINTDPASSDDAAEFSLASYTPKQRLVVRLLRECWKLEIPEVAAIIGLVDVGLKPTDYDLLVGGRTSTLKSISLQYITGDGESIEGYRSGSTIRIKSTLSKSTLIVREIENALQKIERVDLSLKDLSPHSSKSPATREWVREHFDDNTINELSLLTDAGIQRSGLYDLKLSCINLGQDPSKISTNDNVRRLLLTSGNFSKRNVFVLGSGSMAIPQISSGAFVKYPADEGFPWRDRLRQWWRWVSPTGKIESIQSEPSSDEPETSLEAVDGLETSSKDAQAPLQLSDKAKGRKATPEIAQKHTATLNWRKSSTKSSIIFGNILHSDVRGLEPTTEVFNTESLTGSGRQFSTVIPNLSRLLASDMITPISNDSSADAVILHLIPNPFFKPRGATNAIGAEALSAFPAVEMHLRPDPYTSMLELSGIQAIVSVMNSDLMLPDHHVDLRFHQKTSVRLKVAPKNYPQGLKSFFNKSNLSLNFGQRENFGRFSTPPRVILPMSTHLCRDPGIKLLQKEAPESRDLFGVEYLYAGLEVRRTRAMEFEGWRLLYTSIEAGQSGGRRGELRLVPSRSTPFTQGNVEEELVAAAIRLAGVLEEGKGTSAVRKFYTGGIFQKVRPVRHRYETFKPFPLEVEMENLDDALGSLIEKEVDVPESRVEAQPDADAYLGAASHTSARTQPLSTEEKAEAEAQEEEEFRRQTEAVLEAEERQGKVDGETQADEDR